MTEPVKTNGPKITVNSSLSDADTSGLQAVTGGVSLGMGPLRDQATILEDSVGVGVGGQYRAGDWIFFGGFETRSRTAPDSVNLDTRFKFYAVDIRTLWQQQGSHLGVTLVQMAGFDAVTTRRGDGSHGGGGLHPGNIDQIAIGLRSGRSWAPNMLMFRLEHGAALFSTDDTVMPLVGGERAPHWGMTQGISLGWVENFYGPRDDLKAAENRLLELQGPDGKGGKVEERRVAQQKLDHLKNLLYEIDDRENTTPPQPRYPLDYLIWRYPELDEVDSLVRTKFLPGAIQKRFKEPDCSEKEREQLGVIVEELTILSLFDILQRKDSSSRLTQKLLLTMNREAFKTRLAELEMAEKREFRKEFGDLDERIAAAQQKIAETRERITTSQLPYHAANIISRSWSSIQMNNLADDVYGIEGTKDKGKLFILGLNALYDIPLVLSADSFIVDSPHSLGLISAAALGAFGAYQTWQGFSDDNLGQLGNGIVLSTAVVESLPVLFGGKDTYSKTARIAIAAAAGIGFGVAGVMKTRNGNPDDDAVGYRLMSIGANQALAGGIIFLW